MGIKSRLAASLTVVAMLGLLGVQSVTATHVAPGETMPGNYQCPAGSTKIDPVEDGTYALAGGGTITIDVRSTASGTVFDFTTNGATVGSIVVKGGPNYPTYIYAPRARATRPPLADNANTASGTPEPPVHREHHEGRPDPRSNGETSHAAR